MNQRVLVIDDEPSMLSLLRDELEPRGYAISAHTSPSAALNQLADHDFDLVLCDIRMQRVNGIDLCRQFLDLREDVPVVMMTGYASMDSAIGAMRAGAFDFVTKPFRTEDLVVTIQRALEHRAVRSTVRRLRQTEEELPPTDEIVGQSTAMKRLYAVIARVAATDATALISGESGTGKELVARALHARSGRCRGRFIGISCAAMPETLLESELFGHAKGAFTDASAANPGLLQSAGGGTLFLDEVGEMPPGMQAKLLRAIQERKARPVGAEREVPFDVRIIAATNRDLEDEVARGRFRADLLYRLDVVRLLVPPLRERDGDVRLLAQAFLQRRHSAGGQVSGLSEEAAECLRNYPWPGNVRELQNCIERGVALARFDHLGIDDLPERVHNYKAPPGEPAPVHDGSSEVVSLEVVERLNITQVLHAMGGNKAAAARVLGLNRKTLYRKLRRWRGRAPQAPRSTR